MELQKSLFEGREGDVFHLHGEIDSPINLTLAVVESPSEHILQRARETGVREPFSLLFCGPLEQFLEQHMYSLHHAELGQLELFLVPVKQDDNGFYYEAVFG